MNPKCTYKKGDVIMKANVMGIVIENTDRFCTFQFMESHGSTTHTTANISIKHYLKAIRAASQANIASGLIVRNITLEQELLEADEVMQDAMINGRIDRLSEATKNNIEKEIEYGRL